MLSQTAQKVILQEVPVSNLVTPFWHVGLSQRVADYEPRGSDYYVIRSDLAVSVAPLEDTSGSNRGRTGQGILLLYFLILAINADVI